MSFRLGRTYTREQIHQVLGGDPQSYLPHVDGEVVCACLRPDSNPDAPRTILVGEGEDIQHWGRRLAQQDAPIPVFLREAAHEWRFQGEYDVVSSTTAAPELERHQDAAEQRQEPVTRLIRLSPTLPVEVFDEQDEPFLDWMDAHGDGLLLNTKRSRGSTYAVFHRVGCSHIRSAADSWQENAFTGHDYIKVCAQRPAPLKRWLRVHRPNALSSAKRCQDCRPDIDLSFQGPLYPGEVDLGSEEDRPQTYTEGTVQTVTVNRRERNADARAACIEEWGTNCQVCGLDFGERYGEIGEGFIHVHHLTPLAEGGTQNVDPVKDLRPVCPNCHAMLHQTSPPLSIEELRQRMRD